MPLMTNGARMGFGWKTPRRKRKVRLGRPKKVGAGVSHLRRSVDPRVPMHVTMKMRRHVWQLRSRRCFGILERAFYRAARHEHARIVHFSVQHDHVHLIVEATDRVALARLLQGFAISVAKRLNKLMGRSGAVFADRYHARALRTPTEVRRVLAYVLNNGRKHVIGGRGFRVGWVDPCSSGAFFDGWADGRAAALGPAPVQRAATWLLATGWRERGGGKIRPEDAPAG